MTTKVLSFGAIVWDVINDTEYIGGAPLNVAAHLAKWGIESYMISRVGNDRLGIMAIKEADNLGIKTSYIQKDPIYHTGIAICSIDSDGIAKYEIPDDAAYNYIEYPQSLKEDIGDIEYDAFYFGTFEQRGAVSLRSLKRILNTFRFKNVFCDFNIRQNFHPTDVIVYSLQNSNIVKMNEQEAEVISTQLYGSYEGDEGFGRRISSDYGIKIVCITKGSEGYSLIYNGQFSTYHANIVHVCDTIGAGDAFSAAFLACFCRTQNPYASGKLANYVGSYVASQKSAVPAYSNEMEIKIRDYTDM